MPEPTDEQISALAVIQEQITALTDPGPAVESIAAGLDELYATGANAGALSTIQSGAEALLQTAQQLDHALKSTMETAKQLVKQRQETQAALQELRKAVHDGDSTNPDVAVLFDQLSDEIHDQEYWDLNEMLMDGLPYDIVDATGLDTSEAVTLLSLLLDGEIEQDDPIWQGLSEWIAKAVKIVEAQYA